MAPEWDAQGPPPQAQWRLSGELCCGFLSLCRSPARLGDLAGTAEGEGVRGDLLGDAAASGDVGAVADGDRGDQGGVGADEDAVADGGLVLVDAVVVAGDDAGADVDAGTDDRVAEVGEVVGLGAGAEG